MVKKIFIPILFLLLINIVSAQRFEGGLLAGYNASQVEGDTYKGFNKPGIVAGFFVQTDVAPAVFLAFEIKYSQKGARNKIKPEFPEKYIMRLGYVDIPVYAAFRTNDRGSIIGGLSTGFLIHSKEFDEYGEFQVEDQNVFNTIDLQPFLGFQFDFLDNLKADLRFALSVLPVRGQPGEGTNYYWQNNQFNNVLTLALYYNLNR
ncbi:MAG: PorT family protein [Bacteroidetes bacterium]|nr:PorT family protein [Bacteroidota bacterium]